MQPPWYLDLQQLARMISRTLKVEVSIQELGLRSDKIGQKAGRIQISQYSDKIRIIANKSLQIGAPARKFSGSCFKFRFLTGETDFATQIER
jgi:hypothetical protein